MMNVNTPRPTDSSPRREARGGRALAAATLALMAFAAVISGCGNEPPRTGHYGQIADAIDELVAAGEGAVLIREPDSGRLLRITAGGQRLALQAPGDNLDENQQSYMVETFGMVDQVELFNGVRGYQAEFSPERATHVARIARSVLQGIYGIPENANLDIERE